MTGDVTREATDEAPDEATDEVTAGAEPDAAAADETAWHRLSLRLIPVHLTWLVAPVVSGIGTLIGTGGKLNLQALLTIASFTVAFLIVAGINLTRVLTTGYRITDTRLELRSGLLFRSRRSVPLERIRSADVTARPLHRLFGLATVNVGAAVHGASAARSLSLEGVTLARAHALQQELLNGRAARLARGAAAADPDEALDPAAPPVPAPVAELSWSWLRYAPLTIWGVGGLLAVLGICYNTLHEMQIDPLKLGVVHQLAAAFTAVPLWVAVPALLLVVAALGTVVAVGQYVEGWYGYRLEREDGGVLRLRRGLWKHRSVSIEERRLRGLELVESLLLRWGGGARLYAVATGLGNAEENRTRGILVPPAPRGEALRVADELSPDGQPSPVAAELTAHPRVARRRRINRGLAVVACVAVLVALPGIWVPGFLPAAGVVAAVLLPCAVWFGVDAHRALGHALVRDHLVARSGTFARRTVALQRTGVIGWTVSRSVFQRRSGLITLTATTAAGRGAYRVRDVTLAEGLSLAEQAVPDLLTPFLERD
ncbi:PH domain-containing protein [Streptacidiphilus neutrinimicus]|uniref:PH domain-containing protein n=1 Tax=Streptacidiphilus neutrinimicus TaxID=105420 RepID=UPI000A04C83E|nr:PH domain-containing protein [Streptacidiphilus neutrinimicus]